MREESRAVKHASYLKTSVRRRQPSWFGFEASSELSECGPNSIIIHRLPWGQSLAAVYMEIIRSFLGDKHVILMPYHGLSTPVVNINPSHDYGKIGLFAEALGGRGRASPYDYRIWGQHRRQCGSRGRSHFCYARLTMCALVVGVHVVVIVDTPSNVLTAVGNYGGRWGVNPDLNSLRTRGNVNRNDRGNVSVDALSAARI